ncbi:Tegument protein [Trichinella spiralis]|uniref:Tegument protein n=1 Tax=Trichinella spiralis TaxID=6334 RepID=A0ABR3L2W3_TRISP
MTAPPDCSRMWMAGIRPAVYSRRRDADQRGTLFHFWIDYLRKRFSCANHDCSELFVTSGQVQSSILLTEFEYLSQVAKEELNMKAAVLDAFNNRRPTPKS